MQHQSPPPTKDAPLGSSPDFHPLPVNSVPQNQDAGPPQGPATTAEGQRQQPLQRRDLVSALTGLAAGLVAGWAALKSVLIRRAEAAPLPPPLAEPTGALLVRMQQDLQRAIESGQTPSWVMIVDTRKCVGCNACTVACRAENPQGPAGSFRRVIQLHFTPGLRPVSIFKPFNCLQCDNPPCAKAVPAGAIRKRPDGIVELDQDQLRGPLALAAAQGCPFGAIHVDDGKTFTEATPQPQAYEARRFTEYGRTYARTPGANPLADTARKCHFCAHLLEAGVLPACVSTCIGGAMYFGNLNDPQSLVHEILGGRRRFAYFDRLGVGPRVIYFEEPMPGASALDCSACHV